jgi:hypothetical protein
LVSTPAPIRWGAVVAASAACITLCAFAACSSREAESAPGINSGGGSGNVAGGGTAASGNGLATGGTVLIQPDATPPDPVDDAGHDREIICDPTTGECTCVNIGLLGRLPTYGAVPGQDNTAALEAWLNEKSSAVVVTHTTDVAITPEFLSQYDVLILQALENQEGGPYWDYEGQEVVALRQWVEAGGGIISMMGYGAVANEVNPTNTLLSFSGFSYNGDDILYECGLVPVCCHCLGSSVPMEGWNQNHPISANINSVGVFHGRSINAPAEAEIVAEGEGGIYGATLQWGEGRIFVFNDEWVSYTSQWTGEGVDDDCMTDTDDVCYGISPDTQYQVPQFWYNAIKWVSDRECFTIDEPTIVY